MLLIAGGSRDPNLASLCSVAKSSGVSFVPLLFGEDWPVVSWDLAADEFWIGPESVRPSAAFIRYDVFNCMVDPRQNVERAALAWYETLEGWTSCHPECSVLNANANSRINKPLALRLAAAAGLPVPRTIVTNDLSRIIEASNRYALVSKPVAGGDYCHAVETALSSEDAEWIPAIPTVLQERLNAPEVRVYRVGGQLLHFRIEAPTIDYRMSPDCVVTPIDQRLIPDGLNEGIIRLTDQLGLNFAAIDFKSCNQTGELLFLEVNTQPMFAAFDGVSDGAISGAIVSTLMAASSMR